MTTCQSPSIRASQGISHRRQLGEVDSANPFVEDRPCLHVSHSLCVRNTQATPDHYKRHAPPPTPPQRQQ